MMTKSSKNLTGGSPSRYTRRAPEPIEAAMLDAAFGSRPVSVVSHIAIALDDSPRRSGVLSVYDIEGNELFRCNCIGRGTVSDDNPTRDPLQKYGDTPLGKYGTTYASRLPVPVPGIGHYFIALQADDLFDTQALHAERAGRIGLGIIAGRGENYLPATHGSIRIGNGDMEELVRVLGKSRFTVTISNPADAPQFDFSVDGKRIDEIRKIEEGLARAYGSKNKPHFWHDHFIRQFLIMGFGYLTLNRAVERLSATVGAARCPSRSAINRFWQVLGNFLSA